MIIDPEGQLEHAIEQVEEDESLTEYERERIIKDLYEEFKKKYPDL